LEIISKEEVLFKTIKLAEQI